MQQEWSDDNAVAGGKRHRDAMLRGIRKVRKAIDDFNPDFDVI